MKYNRFLKNKKLKGYIIIEVIAAMVIIMAFLPVFTSAITITGRNIEAGEKYEEIENAIEEHKILITKQGFDNISEKTAYGDFEVVSRIESINLDFKKMICKIYDDENNMVLEFYYYKYDEK